MRCRDVSRAIAAPDGAINEAELEAHLAGCPRCASLAERSRALDRLWEATRPDLPSPGDWGSAWARIDHELASAATPSEASRSARSQGRRRAPIRLVVAGLAMTAAAALLLALNPTGPAPEMAEAREPVFGTIDVPVGHTVLYHVDTAEHRVIQVGDPAPPVEDDLTFFGQLEAGLDAVDYFALFGWFEAMPASVASNANAADDGASPFDPLPH